MLFRQKLQYFLVKNCSLSYKEALLFIEEGKVMVNGFLVGENIVIHPEDEIKLENTILQKKTVFYYLLLNKPVGIETTLNTTIENNLLSIFQFHEHVYPVGRLDKHSEGMLLLTNDGKLANRIISPAFNHEKEYEVELDAPFTSVFIENMRRGMFIKGRKTKPALVIPTGSTTFKITLTEGMNRQIRRMCAVQGSRVIQLKRTRMLTLQLGELKPGEYRHLEEKEISDLKNELFI